RVGRHGRDDFLDRPRSRDDNDPDDAELAGQSGSPATALQGDHRRGGNTVTMTVPRHLTTAELEAGLEDVRRAPAGRGVLELIVRRPAEGERESLAEGELDPEIGLVGDTWSTRISRRTHDGSPHREMQLNIMNARVVALVAQARERWPLAGDQLFVDMD